MTSDKCIEYAIEYKTKYNSTPWWKFKKRKYYHDMYMSALDLSSRINKNKK